MANRIYAFVYGAEGVGKTLLPMTLADETGHGVAYVTAETRGPTSLVTAGWPSDIPVEVLPPGGEDPFPPAAAAVEAFTKDKSIRCICLDGLTVMTGRAVDYRTDGAGEKSMEYDGWQWLLAEFRALEILCEKAVRAGKSVVMTAWESPPTYETTLGGEALKDEGRPMLQGKAKFWLPGGADVVARMTSTTIKDPKTKELTFKGQLQVHRRNDWLAKTRWRLPDPCPADLRRILALVQGQAQKAQPSVVRRPVPQQVK